ncbi:MAG: pyruvate formate lyase family protein [Armatimonadia bacterium]
MDRLRSELRSYYHVHRDENPEAYDKAREICRAMDEFDEQNPGLSPYLLKATLHETIAERFVPAIFPHSPFYWEMGTKPGRSWGVPNGQNPAGGWMFLHRNHLFRERSWANDRIRELREKLVISMSYGLYPDTDHHCFPCSRVVEDGLRSLYEQAQAVEPECATQDEADFITSVKRSLLATKTVAEKFAAEAQRLLPTAEDEQAEKFLGMIAQTARRVPWEPAQSLYEGLAALWFLREVCGSLEGIGVSVIGHPDRLLYGLYCADLDSGRLTQEEALDLICRFLLPTDHKKDFTVSDGYNPWETSTTLVLGGCDAEGKEVCNDLTFLFLRAHEQCGLINPKLNCRYSARSRPEYLGEINRQILAGRNVFALFNDDCLIEAQVRAGKRLEDARLYVAGGCHEPILEGFEHSAGTNCYVNLPRILDLSIHRHPELQDDLAQIGLPLRKLDEAREAEDVYDIAFHNLLATIVQGTGMIEHNGKAWSSVNPAPLFSAALRDCIANRKDYTAGGGRYNPTALPLVGFANLVDSLHVVRHLCFETGKYDLHDFLEVVRANWEGHEALRREVIALPKYGDNLPEINALTKRLSDDLFHHTRGLRNERGGSFQLCYFVYIEYMHWGRKTFATPDGRRNGDLLSLGISPSRLHRIDSITSAIGSAASVDMRQCAANAILDLQLPLGHLNPDVLMALERTFVAEGLATLQMNCVDLEALREARRHPELHQDLLVRVCGFSAHYVNLPEWMQDELLERNLYAMA